MRNPSPGRIACLVMPELQDQQAWEHVLEILGAYSPLVEEGTLGAAGQGACIYLDASGVAPRYGSEEAWCRAILAEVGPHPPWTWHRPGPSLSHPDRGRGGREESGGAPSPGGSSFPIPHPDHRREESGGAPWSGGSSSPLSHAPCESGFSGSGMGSSPLSHAPCESGFRGSGMGSSPLSHAPHGRGAGGEGLLGVASSKFAAWVAAHSAPADPGYLIVNGPDRLFLAPLPVAWLPLPAEVQRRLQMLGIRTIGRFALLPPSAVAEQFTPESLAVHRWARGLDDRPVIGRRCQVVQAHCDFETPEDRREALVVAALRLSHRALRDLPVSPRAWAVKRIELQATFSEGEQAQRSVWVPMPWADDTLGQQALRALLESMVDSLKEDRLEDVAQVSKLAAPGQKGEPQVYLRSEGRQLAVQGREDVAQVAKLASSAQRGEPQVYLRSEGRQLAVQGEGGVAQVAKLAHQGITELTVKLLGLEPAQGRQMDLFASIETRRRLEETLQQLAKKHASCVALVVALDVEAPILEERYSFVVQAAYPVPRFS